MKKMFFILISILVLLIAFILEGGEIRNLFQFTALFALIFTVIFSTLATFKFSEIINVFKDGFSQKVIDTKVKDYEKGILITKSVEKLIHFWSITILTMAIIFALGAVSNAIQLGRSVAIAFMVILYAVILRASILTPVENELNRKLFELKK